MFLCALKPADQVRSDKDGVIVSFFGGDDAADQLQDSNKSSYLEVFNLT